MKFDLCGSWKLTRLENGKNYSAYVPGNVHTDLANSGAIVEDFYMRDNAKTVQWIENEDWKYEKTFNLTRVVKDAYLVFECLDTYADIYLNNRHVANTDDMFITHRFNVDGLLKKGKNTVTVIFHSPVERTKGCIERNHAFTAERLFTRRMQCTYGWDWTMRFVTCGISKPCYIEYEKGFSASDAYVYTEAIDSFGAQLACDIDFENFDGGATYNINIKDDDGIIIYENDRYCNEPQHTEYISVINPKLWYPVGYGKQPLYTLTVTAGKNILTKRFGIRTVRILQVEDKKDSDSYNLCLALKDTESGLEYDANNKFSSFTLIVNGKKIFCKGADWAPCEPFVSEVTNEKLTRLLELAAKIGVNMLRIWGGGMFETSHFYDECDRLGITVTQDFLMACGEYPEDEKWFRASLEKEAEYAARLIRNHPCLVWWTGDNENAIRGNDLMPQYQGRTSAIQVIAPVLKRLDPIRRFLPSSPYGGDKYASKTVGTTHNTQFLGTLFDYIEKNDMLDYKDRFKEFIARFIAEEPTMGAISALSLKRFMNDDDIYNNEEMWYYHTQSNPALKMELFNYHKLFTEKVLGKFKNGEDRLFKLQYAQYEWMRASFEMIRRNMWFCSGQLYWMLADCWPAAAGWSFIDYYCMPKASYYCFGRCAKNIIASIDRKDNKLSLYICNDNFDAPTLDITVSKLNYLTGTEISKSTTNAVAVAQKVTVLPLDISVNDGEIIVCDIKSDSGSDRTFYKNNNLEIVKCDSVKIISKNAGSITLKSDKYTHAVRLEGEYVFSDNYFSMMRGETKTVQIEKIPDSTSDEIIMDCYTLE